MRSLFLLIIPGLLLITVGCVSVPPEQKLLKNGAVHADAATNGSCDKDRIIRHSNGSTSQQVEALDPNRISVLNWNVYKGQRDNWEDDFQRYSYKHDVVIIQEAHLGDSIETLLDKEHHHWSLNASFYLDDRATGVMTASKVQPLYSCGQRTIEPLIRTPKTSLVSYYPVAGQEQNLLVANIHGINFTFGVDVYQQQIDELYEAMKHHRGPVILAGDFNTWSDERMRIVMDMAERLSLSSLDYTNHNHTRTLVFGNALDHVFYRGLEPLEHDTWYVTSSDHNPTQVSFRVKHVTDDEIYLAAK
jgi:endonuclease/exonuclease/phosphatase (EEP) superfamily protein YafD